MRSRNVASRSRGCGRRVRQRGDAARKWKLRAGLQRRKGRDGRESEVYFESFACSFRLTPTYGMSCSLKRRDGCRQILGSHQQVICIEGGDNKQANSRAGKRRGKRSHDAYFRERKGTMNFQRAPASLGRQTGREAGFLGDYGKLVAGARDGEEGPIFSPSRNCAVRYEASQSGSRGSGQKLQWSWRSS